MKEHHCVCPRKSRVVMYQEGAKIRDQTVNRGPATWFLKTKTVTTRARGHVTALGHAMHQQQHAH
jgi:hypothetical protein